MEKGLQEAVSNIMTNEGATGVVVADSNGFCLIASGNAKSSTAGYVSALAARAHAFEPNQAAPTILIETESNNVYIKKQGGVTLGVFKKPQTGDM